MYEPRAAFNISSLRALYDSQNKEQLFQGIEVFMEVFVQIVVLYSLLEGAGYLHLQG
jgi:hypothetical protein